MDISLQGKSSELTNVIQSLIEETKLKAKENDRRLSELSEELRTMDKGDASENAPLQIARDEQAMRFAMMTLLETRIKSMSSEVGEYVPTGFITLGTTVEVRLLKLPAGMSVDHSDLFQFKLVQHDTSDATKQLVAIDSKLGAALLGRAAGEIIEVNAPGGLIEYKIERIY